VSELACHGDAPAYRWDFTDDGRNFSVAVPARVLSTNSTINRRLARAGLGITLALEENVSGELESGELVRVLDRFCQPFPGYYLYYPQRRQASRSLRAFVAYLRRWRHEQRPMQNDGVAL
jgi:DNA-binding transcriptional LysR family regulator